MTIKAHKIRLNPTPEQETYLRRAAGTRRFVYNWGLAEWNRQYAEYKEGKLARAMADAGLGQLLQFFATKMQAVGGQAIVVDRFFPSTKTCSRCGQVKKRMPLRYRIYRCLKCGLVIDRDLNAAINLEREARRILTLEQRAPVQGNGSHRT
jgi:putative transposase